MRREGEGVQEQIDWLCRYLKAAEDRKHQERWFLNKITVQEAKYILEHLQKRFSSLGISPCTVGVGHA